MGILFDRATLGPGVPDEVGWVESPYEDDVNRYVLRVTRHSWRAPSGRGAFKILSMNHPAFMRVQMDRLIGGLLDDVLWSLGIDPSAAQPIAFPVTNGMAQGIAVGVQQGVQVPILDLTTPASIDLSIVAGWWSTQGWPIGPLHRADHVLVAVVDKANAGILQTFPVSLVYE